MRTEARSTTKPDGGVVARPVLAGVKGGVSGIIDLIEKSDTKIWVLLIVSVLLIAQVALVLQVYWGSDLLDRFRGSPSYRQIAENIVAKGLYSLDGVHATAYRQPLYPLFLAALMSIFGHNWILPAICLQSFLDILTGVLTVSISLTVFRSKLGASVVAFLYLIHLGFHFESISQRETVLFALLLLLFTRLLVARRKDFWIYPSLWVVSALAYLTRPTGVLFLPMLILFIALERESLIRSRERLFSLMVGMLLFGAITLPYHTYLYQTFSKVSPFVPQTTNGLNLYQGNNPATERIYPYVDVDLLVPWIQEMLAREGITGEFQSSQFLKDRAIDYIVERPLGFLRRALVKFCALYSPIATPLGFGKLVERDGKIVVSDFRLYLGSEYGTLKNVFRMVDTAFAAILLMGTAAFLMRLRTWYGRYGRQMLFILCPIALVTLTHVITFGETRHRLPLDPLLIILASAYYSAKLQAWSRSVDS